MNVPLSTLAQYKTYVLHCANVDSETEEEETTSSRDGKKRDSKVIMMSCLDLTTPAKNVNRQSTTHAPRSC